MVSSGSHWPSEVVWHLCSQSVSGRQIYFQPAHFPFGPQKGAFYRGQFVIWPRVLIIMLNCLIFRRLVVRSCYSKRPRSHRAIMHIGAVCVWALTVRIQVLPSPSRTAVMIPNVVNIPKASLGHPRVLRLDLFDLGLAVPCWQCIWCHVFFLFCYLRHVCVVSSDCV